MLPPHSLSTRLPVELYVGQRLCGKTPRKLVLACVPITNASAFSQLSLAEAALNEAFAAVESEQANLTAAQHKVQQDEAVYARANRDRIRYQGLVEEGVVSRSDFDTREAEAIADAQMLEADRAIVVSVQHKIAQARSLVTQRQAQIQAARTAPQQVTDARARMESSMGQVGQAKADVRTAELNLGYTKNLCACQRNHWPQNG